MKWPSPYKGLIVFILLASCALLTIEEILDDDKPANNNGISKHGKKKKQLTASHENDSERRSVVKSNAGVILESEDEDEFSIQSNHKHESNSFSVKEKSKEVMDKRSDERVKYKKAQDDGSLRTLKRKVEAMVEDKEEKSESGQQPGSSPADTIVSETDMKQKKEKKKKKKKTDKNEEPMQLVDESRQKKSSEKDLGMDANLVGEEINKKKKNKKGNKNRHPLEKPIGKPVQVRTFPNGLVIEEMFMGKPDGKKASPGKKVSVYYVGKLKKNGEKFDSNFGETPFMFRLGVGEVIKGWDVGVNGMRVGGKRRLTIPPAMGYGSEGAGHTIPPDSWLVFDVELVAVI